MEKKANKKKGLIRKVAVYVRKSRAEDTDDVLRNHRDRLLNLVESNDWDYELFEEVGSSASIEARSEFKKLLENVKAFKYDGVVVVDIDRLSRDEFDLALIKKILREHGVLIITPERTYNLNDTNDVMTTAMFGMVANLEYTMIKKRLREGKIAGARRGQWVQGSPPYGYRYNSDTKQIKIVEKEATVIKRIFRQVAEGDNPVDIATDLNLEGVRATNGGQLTNTQVYRWVRNEAYKGTLIYNRHIGRGSDRNDVKDESDWIVVEDALPAIVDKELWDKANKALVQRAKKSKRANAAIHSLSGLIWCGHCGRQTTIQTRKDKGVSTGDANYRLLASCVRKNGLGNKCGNSGKKFSEVYEAVLDQLRVHREELAAKIQTYKTQDSRYGDEKQERIQRLKEQLQKAGKAVSKLKLMVEEDIITIDEYKERSRIRIEEKEKLQAEIAELEAADITTEVDRLEKRLETLDAILNDKGNLSERELNRMFNRIIERIEWYNMSGVDAEPMLKIITRD